jgi:hypothetical protein
MVDRPLTQFPRDGAVPQALAPQTGSAAYSPHPAHSNTVKKPRHRQRGISPSPRVRKVSRCSLAGPDELARCHGRDGCLAVPQDGRRPPGKSAVRALRSAAHEHQRNTCSTDLGAGPPSEATRTARLPPRPRPRKVGRNARTRLLGGQLWTVHSLSAVSVVLVRPRGPTPRSDGRPAGLSGRVTRRAQSPGPDGFPSPSTMTAGTLCVGERSRANGSGRPGVAQHGDGRVDELADRPATRTATWTANRRARRLPGGDTMDDALGERVVGEETVIEGRRGSRSTGRSHQVQRRLVRSSRTSGAGDQRAGARDRCALAAGQVCVPRRSARCRHKSPSGSAPQSARGRRSAGDRNRAIPSGSSTLRTTHAFSKGWPLGPGMRCMRRRTACTTLPRSQVRGGRSTCR